MKRFAIILAALFTLSVNTAYADALNDSPANHLRFTFHSVASTWSYDPNWDIYSVRTACTDKLLLLIANGKGWEALAKHLKVVTFFDAEYQRPLIRSIFDQECAS